MGHDQRKIISSVLQGVKVSESDKVVQKTAVESVKIVQDKPIGEKTQKTVDVCNSVTQDKVSQIVCQFINKIKNKGKTVIRLEMETNNE